MSRPTVTSVCDDIAVVSETLYALYEECAGAFEGGDGFELFFLFEQAG